MARVLLSISVCLCVLGVFSAPAPDGFQKNMERVASYIEHRYDTDPAYAQFLNQWIKEQRGSLLNETFTCEYLAPSAEVPTSVHALRPGDVNVVAALGDSLTAGRGASGGIIGLLFDYPELSWSIGGYKTFDEQLTVPNVLREYNPDLIGYSTSSSNWGFNKAVSGATSDQTLEQAKILVSALQNDDNVDFENDWKVVTVFIGANDLCAACKDYDYYSSKNYIKNIQDALDYMQETMPRTFVNLVEMLNVDIIHDLAGDWVCDVLQWFECNCVTSPASEEAWERLKNIRAEYQEYAVELVDTGRYDTRDDFTVVLQPFYKETWAPLLPDGSYDLSYFASDCFHESSKGQQAAAKALWNNMVERVGAKRIDWHPDEPLECPTEEFPYLFTALNSKL